MTRGIVEKIIDKNHYKVRIPEYNGLINTDYDFVDTDSLQTATVCSLPGNSLSYKAGDIVFVTFERDSIDNPVIMGLIQGANSTYTACDIVSDSVEIKVNCKLPLHTEIGGVQPNDLQQVQGARNNLQRQIDLIVEKINAIITDTPVGKCGIEVIEEDMQFKGGKQ